MKKTALTVAMTLIPAVLAAQQGSVSASANAEASIPAKYTAESRAKLQAAIQAARAKDLPEEPMQRRIAEGEAKGASEVQVVAAVQKLEARLEATQSAMIRAGRAKPAQDEVARGSQAMEQGATEAQIEALVKHAPSDRSLVVAFDVLTKLSAGGASMDHALAQIQTKLDARATDGAINSLVANAGVTGAVTGAVLPKKP